VVAGEDDDAEPRARQKPIVAFKGRGFAVAAPGGRKMICVTVRTSAQRAAMPGLQTSTLKPNYGLSR
jgi:hypothetical protein